MAIKKTKKQVQVKEITIDERGQAMNDIAILFCNNKQMTYSEIQRHFDFTVSGILLEMELAGLIYQKHYECYVPVEEAVEEIAEEIESKTNLHKETDNARQEWLELEDLAGAFLSEYGSYPSEPTLKEGNDSSSKFTGNSLLLW